LLSGSIAFEPPAGGGTLVRLNIPKPTPESHV